MLSPFIDSSIDNVLLQTNPGCTSRFLTSQTFLNIICRHTAVCQSNVVIDLLLGPTD